MCDNERLKIMWKKIDLPPLATTKNNEKNIIKAQTNLGI
jgi:hypothetical protein